MPQLVTVRLKKPWGKHKAGETVTVDSVRAAVLLIDHGLAVDPTRAEAAEEPDEE